MSEETVRQQYSLFDECLIEGEKIIASTENIFDSKNGSPVLGISSQRVLVSYGINSFYDIKYGEIVSMGWKYTYKYVEKLFIALFLTVSFLIVGIGLREEIIIEMGFVFLVVTALFFLAYLSSKKTVFFITTTDTKEHQFILQVWFAF
jgi:hypothetical protein